ncbi:MAG TPA: TetR family transcriptional regulator [Candidatus Kapabacteria bacterium]|nr:TetR family transcriptional regulator [Candidatus Kapabacteria bacterium]
MTARKPSLTKTVAAQGKRLLMDAALKLTAQSRSINALGLRELAREAGLNPNTFYRHFKDIDELGLTIIEEMSNKLRQPLRDLRRQAAESVVPPELAGIGWEENPLLNLQKATLATKETVKLFFDYVAQNPNAFILGVRELHGASPLLRQALRKVMADFAQDMADDIKQLKLLPMLDDATLLEVASTISREMFQLSMDYIEQPEQRNAIFAQAEALVVMLFTGATVLKGHGRLLMQALDPLPA